MTKAGIDPASVENVAQQFDMVGLLEGDIDAAEAMTYNEYAQVLEAINPDTGELYTPDDFNVISYEDEGVGMLQDAIWADGTRLADAGLQRTRPSASWRPRCRVGRTAATTSRAAPSIVSGHRARSSASPTRRGR